MPTKTECEEYRPKFKVGQEVWIREGLRDAYRGTITERKVYRQRRNLGAFYVLDDGAAQAWEVFITPVSNKVRPTVAAERIIATFRDRGFAQYRIEQVNYRDSAPKVWVHIEAHCPVKRDGSNVVKVTLMTWTDENGNVETIGPWEWFVADSDGPSGSDLNLGNAVVGAYNSAMAWNKAE